MSTITKFFIQTFGCQMNVYDGQRIATMLEAHNMIQTDDLSEADLIILNTCAVREKATNKVYSALGRIRKAKKPTALFGIVGCVARESGSDAFKRIPELNFVLGPQSYHKLPELIKDPASKLLNIDLTGLEKFDELPTMQQTPLVAYIPVQEGCNHCCTYCIVPYTRGRELSRPFDDIIKDTINAANTGAIEICFLGQNVNGYKYTDPAGKIFKLSDVIRETAKIDNVKRIRFTSSYPTEMTDDLIDMFATESKLLPFLNMPIQSGSERILKLMHRPDNLKMYFNIVDKLKQARPDIQISSDFIVGFPDETEEDFQCTVDIAKKIKYINSYSFKYSPRPHTAAAIMPNQISEQIKSVRLQLLDSQLNINQREFNLSCIGKEMLCLFEGPDKTGTKLVYRTPYMQQCIIDKKHDDNITSLQMIKITEANKSCLKGEPIK
ncbi:MAG: tRNA (N6-isopentenyl adenosine(37)-C2)-methylthiotransferase MiaB [Alphaproteobacteria bacterium]|nr:tRNA (N6-isopentenyl adenosine(37)-C2)-methylthiotransferase MiaB [Alphaproteobacteria bacterium]